MKFAQVATETAAGGILAHSIVVEERRWAKGRVLDASDIALAAGAGILQLTIARLDANDIGEDAAAVQLASALCGPGLVALPATHGRVNLAAAVAGMCRIDAAMVGAVNKVDEALTLATLAPGARVAAGEIIATIKIIPYAVSRGILDSAIAVALPLAVSAFRPWAVTLVQTRLPGVSTKLLGKTARVTRARIESLGGGLHELAPCPHETGALAAVLAAAPGDMLLIAGASATVDRGDVIPAAILAAGGTVERLGMPVDPGNLLCLGWLANRPVIGLPGCARSPKRNGFDLVIEALFAGVPVTADSIAAMGTGGLLPEAERPQPRAGRNRAAPATTGAIILAAGRSSRMEGANKLLEDWQGKPLIAYVVDAVAAAGLPPPVVVLGARADALRAALGGRRARFVVAADYADGLAHSLRAGIAAVPVGWDAALICLGDMPRIAPALLKALATTPGDVVVPVWQGKRGNPVRWGRAHFVALSGLVGDVGGKALLADLAQPPTEIAADCDAIFDDIDTPTALAALRRRVS